MIPINKKYLTWILATMVAVLSAPQSSYAEQGLAASSAMPYITLLDGFTLYASKDTRPNEALGALSALQSVHLAPIKNSMLLDIMSMQKIQVETWLGNVWINLKEGSYKYGKLVTQDENLTLLDMETQIYDAPLKITDYKLAPQKVQAIASLSTCDPYTPCRSEDKWYLIHTSWLGDKWIRPYEFAEKYKGIAVDGLIPIAQESAVYMFPFDEPIANEAKLKPQLVKPLAKYMRTSMAGASVWYQLDTSQGLRWIHLDSDYGLGIEGIEHVDLTIDLPVPFHYYKTPDSYNEASTSEEPPQAVHTIGKKNDWYFTITKDSGAGEWINPSQEIASRLTGDFENDQKLGVKKSQLSIELSTTSIALDTPYEDSLAMNNALTFSRQFVTALRVWISPNGQMWYYINTWKGFKWVRL
ncbi:hypothetical protein [Paenibacillus aceris]|uniref:Uncharacterized protein n=1 Tax=Paenibacillus aceris TaxID=869555 RepID=A0ABS4IA30_9BACL|nr:hypothetical protein [Paenibacillus aceris]MBP1967777.1 hypothetical protein [Paenibacillus aceris]NHW38201.1 hypothetical protein [Paenibacillus aceris]